MATRRFRAACGVLVASASLSGPACMKPNPAFVDTDGSASDDVGDGESTAGCTADDGLSDPDSEGDAIALGTVAAGPTPHVVEGALTPDTTSWWFAFTTAADSGTGHVVASVEADAAPQLCVFAECVDAPGVPSLLCDGGATVQRSPLGRAGCCAAGSVGLWHACTGDVSVFLRVEDDATLACVPFQLEYRVTEPGA